MKQIFMALALLCGVNLTACAQKQKTQPMTHDVKILVAYFSATGTTAEAAAKLARVTGGELFAVTPRQAYTAADLDWHDKQSRSSVEMNDEKARPALKTKKTDMAAYDVVFIGYPIWWGVAPTVVNTFLECYDFSGKTIVLFATSGGSGLGRSAAGLRGSVAADTKIVEGRMLNGRLSPAGLKEWTDSLKL